MKKVALLLPMLALMALTASAQLLWKVSGNGLQKDSYILATRHDVPISVLNMIPGLETAMNNCDIYVGEVVGEGSDSDDNKLEKILLAPSDSTLDKLYTPQEYRFVMEKLGECLGNKRDLSKVKNINVKPLALVVIMSAPLLLSNVLIDGDTHNIESMDGTMEKRAVERGIPTMGLETHEFQNKLIMEQYLNTLNLPLKTQATVLLEYCKTLDGDMEEYLMKYGAYMSQRLDWYEMTSDAYEDESVIARNHDWIPKLMPVMQEKSCLVAVGIGHVAGDEGLLQLLRKKGYTVEPMR